MAKKKVPCITREEFAEILNLIHKQVKLDHDFTGDMQKYMDGHSVAAFSENAVNAAIRSLSIMFEDQEPVNSTWISWFCFENDFGAGKMKCPLDKAEYEIDSAEAMYDFMVLWMNV